MLAGAVEERLRRAGLALPDPPRPAGAYRAVVVRGALGFVSGQLPFRGGALPWRGRVGVELGLDDAREAARIAALNALAQIHAARPGWRGFAGLCRLDGWVASGDGFLAQPAVLDAASDLLVTILGDDLGAHARTAFAVPRLPLDAPIELVVTFAVEAGLSP
jgi:enamine deaminase RidA (YjgF/YER057c/UK114 family)